MSWRGSRLLPVAALALCVASCTTGIDGRRSTGQARGALPGAACDDDASCDPGELCCDGACVVRDDANCSVCGDACAAGTTCVEGACSPPVVCVVTDPVDRPTLANVDGNCDGIVGNAGNAIFVDGAGGNDANPGTMLSPMRTVQAGIGAASAVGRDVYVSLGSYAESVTLADGVSVFGGYDAAAGWSRSAVNITTVASPTATGISATNLARPTEVQSLAVVASDAVGRDGSGDGQSSVGILAVNAAGLAITGCSVSAGAGAPGNEGMPGAAGLDAPDSSGSLATVLTCPDGAQGRGGAGGPWGSDGLPGTPGAAPGGLGGTAGNPDCTAGPNGGLGQDAQPPGADGDPAENGAPASALGGIDPTGNYIPASGGDGLGELDIVSGRRHATIGGGGGGGGGGGRKNYAWWIVAGKACGAGNFNCVSATPGVGGAGGTGGCGGQNGLGGRGGGGSFAVLSVASSVQINSSLLVAGSGGAGGAGGDGGVGGKGGKGARGGLNSRTQLPVCPLGNYVAGDGGAGAMGGAGGRGGGGAGGAGGPSVCVVHKGPAPATIDSSCVAGVGGVGGAGGAGALDAAPQGPAGPGLDVLAIP